MAEGGISTRARHAPTWLRSEGLFCAALLVPGQGAPAILDARQKVDERGLARLCVALARSNALVTAWQALAIALVEPELREAIADSEAIEKLDAILGNVPVLAAWFELPVRSAAATELRAMLDNAVGLPAVQSESLSQWFDKPVARLASVVAEHLALQLEAQGMRALPFVLGVPSSPAFRELATQSSAQLRRLSASLAEDPTRHLGPTLTDRWIADLYVEARYVGRARSDVVARGGPSESSVRTAESVRGSADELAFGDDVSAPIAERAIDEEWITLADLHASLDDAPRVELPMPESEAPAQERPAQMRRASVHVGLAMLAGALAGCAAVAMFMALEGREDRRPALERNLEAERNATLAVPSVPTVTAEPLAVVAPVAMGLEPAPAATASAGAMAAPIDPGEVAPGSAGSGLSAPPRNSATTEQIASPAVTPRASISKTCDLALIYAQRGEIAQAIRRFENCLSPERELVRQRIGQRGAVEVRAKAEKGQCDVAAAIVAQIESIEAAGPAKVALASLCDSRAREVENETTGP